MLLDADKDVQSALQATVTQGRAQAWAPQASFTSSQPIKLTVRCL